MLARWMFAETEVEFFRKLQEIPRNVFFREFQFVVDRSPLILFDSAWPGRQVKNWPGKHLSIELDPGGYVIDTAVYQPDAQTCMVVHRLEPTS